MLGRWSVFVAPVLAAARPPLLPDFEGDARRVVYCGCATVFAAKDLAQLEWYCIGGRSRKAHRSSSSTDL